MTNGLRSKELLEMGHASLEVAEFDDAIEIFSQAAIEDSTSAEAWFYLGVCYYETRQPENAIEALNRAIATNPDYADAHYLLGTVVGASGQIEQAADCYRRALAINPHHHKAEEFLIRTESLLASRQHYRNAMKLIYSDKREDDWVNLATRELLESVAIFGDSPAKAELSRVAHEIIETDRRRSLSDLAYIEGPFWTNAVRNAEDAFARRRWPEAAAQYGEALDLSPDHTFIHHALGLIYFALGDLESGISAWQRVSSIDPDFDYSAWGEVGR